MLTYTTIVVTFAQKHHHHTYPLKPSGKITRRYKGYSRCTYALAKSHVGIFYLHGSFFIAKKLVKNDV